MGAVNVRKQPGQIEVNYGMAMNDIIRVFPSGTKWTPRGDLSFVGGPPLFGVPDLPVYISVTFSWDMKEARRIAREWSSVTPRVVIGGPACGTYSEEFIPGVFVKEGVTFTSRGCPKNCLWCRVKECEGPLREINIAPGYIVQDNNLLACSRPHIERVFDMLRQQKRGIIFSGGLDIDYLQPWHVDLLKTIRVKELWVACDTAADLKRLEKAADMLADFSVEKKRCYVMIGFGDETPNEGERRCEAVYGKGFLPFVQYNQPDSTTRRVVPKDWRYIVWKWARPAVYRRKAVAMDSE